MDGANGMGNRVVRRVMLIAFAPFMLTSGVENALYLICRRAIRFRFMRTLITRGMLLVGTDQRGAGGFFVICVGGFAGDVFGISTKRWGCWASALMSCF